MERYFLHLKYLDEFIADVEGEVFLDIEAAKNEAALSIREIASYALNTGDPFKLISVRICDVNGDLYGEVFADDVLSPIIPPTSLAL